MRFSMVKKYLAWMAFCLLYSSPAWSQIAADSFKDCTNNGGTGTLTCPSGFTNTAGTVLIFCGVGDLTGGANDAQPPTYNGVALTLLDTSTVGDPANNRFTYTYILQNPPTGNHALLWTSTTNHFLIGGVATYSGTSTSGQPDAHATKNTGAGSATFNSSLTTNADNSWVVVCVSTPTAATSTGLTSRLSGSFSTWALGDSNGAVHPAGSYSFTTTGSGGSDWIINNDVSIKPPSTASANRLLTMGVK